MDVARMKFAILTEKEFEQFAETTPSNNFYQSIEMYRRYQKNGTEAYLLGVKEGKKVLCGAVAVKMSGKKLFKERKIFAALRGYVMDYDQKRWQEVLECMTSGAQKFLRERGGIALRISPNVILTPRDNDGTEVPNDGLQREHLKLMQYLRRLGYKSVGEYGLGKWLYVLETRNKQPEELFKAFRKGTRYSIKWAKNRYGVKVRTLKYDELGFFKKMVVETGERQGFHDRPLSWYQEVYKEFGRKMRFLVAEVPEGKKMTPIAVAMFSLYGDEVTYCFSGSSRKYQKYGGSSLMLWQMIEYACKNDYRQVNFYGARPVRGNGVYEFKRGFNGRVSELVGTFILPIGLAGRIYAAKHRYHEFDERL